MDIEVITKFEDFLKLENEWNKILENSSSDCACLTFEWFKAWWLGFGSNKQLFILLLKDKGNLTGIAPLMINQTRYRGLPVKEIGFIQNDNSPRSDFLLCSKRGEAIDNIVNFLKSIKAGWNMINLVNIQNDSPNFEILQNSLNRNNVLFGIKKGLYSPYLPIHSEWEAFFSALSKKFKKVLRNKINRIERLGPYNITEINDINKLDGVLPKIFEISQRSWKAKQDRAITRSKENTRFFEELTQICGKKGWLDIWLLNVNGKSIAYEYHLRYKGAIYGLRADFDETYKDNSPGSVLDMHIVENAFKNNLKEYDMCGSEDFYKRNWTPHIRGHSNFVIFRNNFYGQFIYFLEFRVISSLRRFKLIYIKLQDIYRQAGYKELFARTFRKILNLIFETNIAIWFERDLSLDMPVIVPQLPVEVNLLAKEETIAWLKQNGEPWMRNQRELDVGLSEVHFFPNLKYQGKIIAYAKVGLGKVYIQDYKIVLTFPEHTAFIYDTYILPQFRRQGIAGFLITEIIKFLKNKEVKKIGCHIPPWNTASINTYTKAGFKKKRYIRYFKLFGLKIFTANPESII